MLNIHDTLLSSSIQTAQQLSESNQLNEAEALYLSILRTEPQNPYTFHGLGVIRAKQGLFTEAIHWFDEALNTLSDAPLLHLHRGHALRSTGNIEAALASYHQAILHDPLHEEAWCHQGHALQQLGNLQHALQSYETTLTYHPHSFEAWYGHGNVLFKLERYEEALNSYEKTLQINPNFAPAWNNRGALFQAFQHYKEAIDNYTQALYFQPEYQDALYNCARSHQCLYQFEQSIPFLNQVIQLQPDHASAFSYRGIAYHHLKEHEKAVHDYDQALALHPQYPEALNNKGAALHALKRLDEALSCYKQALFFSPHYADALYNQGNLFADLNQYEKALEQFNATLHINPIHMDALKNKGAILYKMHRLEEALASYLAALKQRPQPQLSYICGTLFHHLKNPECAIIYYQQAISTANHTFNDLPEAHFKKGVCELLLGHFKEGWEEYEWRLQANSIKDNLGPSQHYYTQYPTWTGKENLKGKTILLHPEQGLGDIIQFCRYISLISEWGAQIILETPPPLHLLISSLPWNIHILLLGETPPPFDYHISLMSLPYACGTLPSTIPAPIPYLSAPPERIGYWKDKFCASNSTKKQHIGLVWSGNPTHDNDQKRSIALKTLAPLLSTQHHFYCLQKDIRDGDLESLRHSTIFTFSTELYDLTETAALISHLDLIISVDTCVAHLAGAMGKTVWILLPYVTDWRWMLTGEDTPWYPSARLFRQPKEGDWDSVIQEIKQALL